MSEVRNIILSMSATLIFFGVVSMLLPEGSLQKAFNTFRSVAIVAVVAMSVIGVSDAVSSFKISDLEIQSQDNTSNAQQILRNLNVEATKNTVENLILQEFSKNKISDIEIEVLVNITEDNSISIIKVHVVCNEGDVLVCENILSNLGIEYEVTERQYNGT